MNPVLPVCPDCFVASQTVQPRPTLGLPVSCVQCAMFRKYPERARWAFSRGDLPASIARELGFITSGPLANSMRAGTCPNCGTSSTSSPGDRFTNAPAIIDVSNDERYKEIAYLLNTSKGIRREMLRELDIIWRDDLRVTEKATRIRAVMAAFDVDEDALPDDVLRLLRAAERLRLSA